MIAIRLIASPLLASSLCALLHEMLPRRHGIVKGASVRNDPFSRPGAHLRKGLSVTITSRGPVPMRSGPSSLASLRFSESRALASATVQVLRGLLLMRLHLFERVRFVSERQATPPLSRRARASRGLHMA